MSKYEEYFIDIPHNRLTQKMQDRYLHNLELEKQISNVLDETGHINGQGRYPIKDMKFGLTNAGNTVCEAIAIYNVLHDKFETIPLSKLIFYDEVLGYLFAFGFFGTKISKVGLFLEKLGVHYIKYSSRHFIRDARNNQFTDGQIFIVCIKNNRKWPISSIHTFEAVYKNKKWIIYNRFNDDCTCRVYDDVNDILSNGRTEGKFLTIYSITDFSEARK